MRDLELVTRPCKCCGAPLSVHMEQLQVRYWCSYCGNGVAEIKKVRVPYVYVPRNRRRSRRVSKELLSVKTWAFMWLILIALMSPFTLYYYYHMF